MSELVSRSEPLDDSLGLLKSKIRELEATAERRVRELAFLNERYHQLLDSVTEYVYTVQIADGRVMSTHHGPGCVAVTGYSAEEFSDDPMLWIQMVHPADRERVTEQSRRLLTGESVSPIEHRILHKSGNHRWVSNSTIPKYDFDGNLVGYDGLIRDITERKRSELAVQETREQQQRAGQFLTNILSNTFMAAVYLDTEFNYLWVNEAYAKSCARLASFFPGKNLFVLFPHLGVRSLFLKTANSAEPLVGTALAITFPDQPERGVTYWDYSLYPIFDNRQGMIGFVLTMAEVTARVRAEEQLRASETRYRTVANYTYDWEYWETPDGTFAYCSPACSRITGHLATEYLENPGLLESLVVAEDLPLWQAHRRELSRSRLPLEVDFRIRKADGQTCWLSQRCASVTAEDGAHLGWRASTRDITARKRAEIQLRTQAELLSLSPVGITVFDESGHFSYCNQAALDLHGYTREEFFTLSAFSLVAPEESEELDIQLKRLREEGQVSGLVHHCRKDGTRIALWTVAKLKTVDGRPTILSTAMDVTERERASKALAESASALSALFEAIQQVVILIECDGTIVTYNGIAAKLLGGSPHELEGTSIFDLATPDVADSRRSTISRVIRTGEPLSFDDQRRGRHYRHKFYPITDQADRVVRIALFIEDTTEQHLADERLRKTNEQLLHLRDAQSRFMTDGNAEPVYDALLQTLVALTDSRFGILDTLEASEAPLSQLCPLASVHLDLDMDESLLCQQMSLLLRRQAPNVWPRDVSPIPSDLTQYATPTTADTLISNHTTIPLVYGGRVVGLVGLANRPTEYDGALLDSIAPFVSSFAATLHAMDTLRRFREQGQLLQDTEDAKRTLVETVPGLVFRLSIQPTWQLLHISGGGVLVATGYSPEELLAPGFDWSRVLFEEDLPRILELVGQARTTRQPREADLRVRASDGSVRWFQARGQVFRGAEDQPTYLDVVAIDISAKRSAETALASKTAELERYFTSALDLLCIVDRTGRFRRLNPAWTQTLGYPLQELEGTLLFDLVHPDDFVTTLKSFGHAENHGQSTSFVNRCRHADGSYRYIEWRSHDVDTLLYATARDVTKRYEAEQLLRASESRYRALVENLPDVVTHFDVNARVLYVSPTSSHVIGVAAGELVGKSFIEADFPKGQAELWQARIQRVLLTGTPDEAEICLETQLRGAVVLDWRLIPVTGPNGVESVLSLARDITAQKRLEREYQALFSEMLSGISIHEVLKGAQDDTPEHRLVAINPAFERLTNLREEDVLGKRLVDVLPSFDPKWLEQYERVASTGTPAHFEAHFSDLDRRFEVTAFRSAPRQVACIYTDITESRRLQEQSHQSAKLEAIGRLAGGIAHDLNNFLMPILGYSEAALDGDIDRDTSLEYIREVRSAGLEAKDLVRQLLSFGKRQEVELRQMDLSVAVVGFAKILAMALREDVRLSLVQANAPVWILADPGQLELVLMNLAVYAQESMPDGGTLTFEIASPAATAEVANTAGPPPAEALLIVRDSGRGMDSETRERIFEPSFAVKSSGRGTGFGLAVVYNIVEQHGGSISVASEVGHGTEFVIRFPILREPAPADNASEAPLSPAHGRRGESILVVEDNSLVRDLAVRTLEAQGYNVRSAASAKDCLSSLGDWSMAFELLLTDVVMPEMSGKALYEILLSRSPNLKVVYMSGYSRDFVCTQYALTRDCAFLQKPFSMRRLLGTLRELLDPAPVSPD